MTTVQKSSAGEPEELSQTQLPPLLGGRRWKRDQRDRERPAEEERRKEPRRVDEKLMRRASRINAAAERALTSHSMGNDQDAKDRWKHARAHLIKGMEDVLSPDSLSTYHDFLTCIRRLHVFSIGNTAETINKAELRVGLETLGFDVDGQVSVKIEGEHKDTLRISTDKGQEWTLKRGKEEDVIVSDGDDVRARLLVESDPENKRRVRLFKLNDTLLDHDMFGRAERGAMKHVVTNDCGFDEDEVAGVWKTLTKGNNRHARRNIFDHLLRARRINTWTTDGNYNGYKVRVREDERYFFREVAENAEVELAESIAKKVIGKRATQSDTTAILLASRAIAEDKGVKTTQILDEVNAVPNQRYSVQNTARVIQNFSQQRRVDEEFTWEHDLRAGKLDIKTLSQRITNSIWIGLTNETTDERLNEGFPIETTPATIFTSFVRKNMSPKNQTRMEREIRRHERDHVADLIKLRMLYMGVVTVLAGEDRQGMGHIRPFEIDPAKHR